MGNADQIKALIKSHLERDDERFYSVALQLAAQSARAGHGHVAQDIRNLIDTAKHQASRTPLARPVPIASPKGELAGLLAVSYPKTRLADMVLTPDVSTRLERILKEQRAGQKLREFGLTPRRKLLLVGPPGTGKTMTASALAGELHLPLYVIVLDALITKFMGETAAKLRLVFDALAHQPGVYLFDEFDAIGGKRAAQNDVGEIGRVLSSFLQFLEQDDSESLIIAATNHPDALDAALYRRFDDVVAYSLPPTEAAKQLIQMVLAAFDVSKISWSKASLAAQDLSHAEISQACADAAKDAVLADTRVIRTPSLVSALNARRHVRLSPSPDPLRAPPRPAPSKRRGSK